MPNTYNTGQSSPHDLQQRRSSGQMNGTLPLKGPSLKDAARSSVRAGRSFIMPNSRDKGKRGERELASVLTSQGHPARRGVQYRGGQDSPDVLCDSLPNIHWEVKRTERLALWPAVEQAKADAGEGQIPVVAHRPNRRDWIVILALHDFTALLRGEQEEE